MPTIRLKASLTLNRDVLGYIFQLNSDIFRDDNALKNTRFASQVCREWRQCILEAPWLWGKLLDLDQLDQQSDNWRDEVLRRGGNSLLWIKGDLARHRKPSRVITPFFVLIAHQHWERVQKMIIQVTAMPTAAAWAPTSLDWLPIRRSAPHLQALGITVHGKDKVSIQSSNRPLFANEAPFLQEFKVNFSFPFSPQLSCRWLAHLRSLHLGPPITLQEILNILQSTPVLRTLQMEAYTNTGIGMAASRTNLPHIHVLDLVQLSITSDLQACDAFLSHITTSTGCSLIFQMSGTSANHLISQDYVMHSRTALQPLSEFTSRYFKAHSPTSVYLDRGFQFIFADNTVSEVNLALNTTRGYETLTGPPLQLPAFIIKDVSQEAMFSCREAANALFDAIFSRLNFSTVTNQKLKFASPETLASLAALLPSIHLIDFDEQTISSYLTLHRHPGQVRSDIPPNTLFPTVKTVQMGGIKLTALVDPASPIKNFLRYRRLAGCPITVLDLTGHHGVFGYPLVHLEEFSGMKVVGKQKSYEGKTTGWEYTLGSGNPDREVPLD